MFRVNGNGFRCARVQKCGHRILCLIALMSPLACSSTRQFRIVSDDDAWIRTATDEKIELKKSEEKEIASGEPFWIESPGKMPILAVPLSNGATVRAKFKALGTPESWDQKEVETRATDLANKILMQSHEIEARISRGDYEGALRATEALLKEHPGLTYLRWMKASSLVLLGKKREAMTWIEETLKMNPNDKTGQEMYRQLRQELRGNS